MTDCQIRFKYCDKEIVIEGQRNELMKDIISRYATKLKLAVDGFSFFYNDTKINPELSLDQINGKDTEILIVVSSNENEDKNKISNYIKCNQCINSVLLEFTNDYCIILKDGKHKTKKIKLQNFQKTQFIDQNEIKCSNCSNTKSEIYQNNFYYCFECDKNFCQKCQSLHNEHKNIINYSLKYFKCPLHQNQNFISYCNDCKKNLCIICTKEHIEHDTIIFTNLFQKKKKLKNILKKYKKLMN